MKRILLIGLFAAFVLTGSVYADATRWNIAQRPNADWWSGARGGRDTAWEWAKDIDELVELQGSPGTGTVFYVDSGVTNEGDGSDWDNAHDTIEEAYDKCTGNAGDIIYVAQGHEETLGTLVLDTEGVTIRGVGRGEDRPEITWDGTGDIITISAASNTLVNLSFLAGVHAITTGINITADGDYTSIIGCDFPEPANNTFDFITAIQLAGASDYVTVAFCSYKHADAVGPAEFIDGGATATQGLMVIGNYLYSEFSVAAIFSDQTDLEVLIKDNIITNMTNNLYAIQMGASATGWLVNNKVATDTYATAIEAGGLAVDDSTVWVDYGQTDVSAVPYFTNVDGVTRWSATELAQIEGEAEDAIEADHLDHLAAVSVADEIVNESFLADITSKTQDWSTFVASTDSLEAISDAITALSGIQFRGDVTAGGSGTTTSTDLSGFGDAFFVTDWVIICTYDVGGSAAAPEGEIRDITGYTSTTGVFTHTAFSAAAASGDKIMISRREDVLIDGLTLAAAPVTGSLSTFIAAGGGSSSLGTDLGADNSLVDVLGSDGVVTTNADAGSLLGAIGTNEAAADTPFTSSTAEADRDGSLIERSEKIIELLETGTLNKLTAPADTYSILDILGSDGSTTTGAVAGSLLGAIGTNEAAADTPFSSSTTESDADGSILEREEYIQVELAKVPKSDSTVSWNATALQAIQDEVEDALQAEHLDHLGNTATGAADMTTEVADGSVLSRIITSDADTSGYDLTTDSLEALADELAKVPKSDSTVSWNATALAAIEAEATDAVEADSLDKLIAADDSAGATAYPDSVAQDSIFAYIMADDASPVVTTFNNTTDSLEAISNALSAGTGATAAIDGDGLDHLVTTADGTGAYPASVAQESIFAYIMGDDATAVATSYDNSTDSLEAISNALAAGTGATAAIEADDLDHLLVASAGTGAYPTNVASESILAYILGDDATAVATTYDNSTDSLEALGIKTADIVADTAAMDTSDELEDLVDPNGVLQDGPRILSDLTGAMSSNYDTGDSPVTIFTVTGDIMARCTAIVNSSVTSDAAGGSLELGVAGDTACLLVQDAVDGTAFVTNDVWTLTQPPDMPSAELDAPWVVIPNGLDIALTVSTQNMAGGVIEFYLQWIPLSPDAAVTGAAP